MISIAFAKRRPCRNSRASSSLNPVRLRFEQNRMRERIIVRLCLIFGIVVTARVEYRGIRPSSSTSSPTSSSSSALSAAFRERVFASLAGFSAGSFLREPGAGGGDRLPFRIAALGNAFVWIIRRAVVEIVDSGIAAAGLRRKN